MGFRHRSLVFCPDHQHDDMELVYHVSGEGFTTLSNGREFPFSRDTLIIYWPKVSHSQTLNKPGEDACILLSVSELDWLPEDHTILCINTLNDSYLQSEFLRLSSISGDPLPRQQLTLNLRATALLMEVMEKGLNPSGFAEDTTTQRLVELAHSYILENFRELESVHDVADYIGLSYDYLRHIFRDTYGMSMKQWLLNVRINQAKLLINHTSLPLKQIAEECGFANVRYFNTRFKLSTGLTPGELRNSA